MYIESFTKLSHRNVYGSKMAANQLRALCWASLLTKKVHIYYYSFYTVHFIWYDEFAGISPIPVSEGIGFILLCTKQTSSSNQSVEISYRTSPITAKSMLTYSVMCICKYKVLKLSFCISC